MYKETAIVAKSLVNLENGEATKVDKEMIADHFILIPHDVVDKTKDILPWSYILLHEHDVSLYDKIGEWIFSVNPSTKDFMRYRMIFIDYMTSHDYKFSKYVIDDILRKNIDDEIESLFSYNHFNLSDHVLNYIANQEKAGNKIRFDLISMNPGLTQYVLSEFSDSLDWSLVSKYHFLDPDFIFNNRGNLDWDEIKKRVNEED